MKQIKTTPLTNFITALFCIFALVVTVPLVAHAQGLDEAAKCGSSIDFSTGAKCKDNQKTARDKAVQDCIADKTTGSAADKEKACKSETKASGRIESLIKTVLNLLSAIVGAVSVIMIIVGGFRFITSGGDSNSTKGARNTILYALVGLVIVAFAQVIVQFVLERI